MPAKLEIEIVDAGTSPIGAPPPPGAGTSVAPPIPVQSNAATSPASASREMQPATRSVETTAGELTTVKEGLRVLATALGQGGLLNVTQLLHRAFTELAAVASGAAGTHSAGRAITAPPVATGDISRAPDIVRRGPSSSPERSTMDAPDIVTTRAPATAAVEGGAGLASAAGPAVLAIGAFAAGIGLATAAVSSFMSSMKAEAEKLANYSPELAGATANSEIRETLAEMRRAESNGPQLAKFEAERSKLETKMYDIMTKIQGAILDFIVPAMRVITALPQIIPGAAEVTMDRLKVMFDQFLNLFFDLKAQLGADAKELGKAQRRLEDIMDDAFNKEDDDVGADPFLAEFMGMDNGAGPVFGGNRGGRGRAAPGL